MKTRVVVSEDKGFAVSFCFRRVRSCRSARLKSACSSRPRQPRSMSEQFTVTSQVRLLPLPLSAVKAAANTPPGQWAPVPWLGRVCAQQGPAGTCPLSLQLPGHLLYFDFFPLSCSECCLYLVCSSSLGENTLRCTQKEEEQNFWHFLKFHTQHRGWSLWMYCIS